MGVLSCHISWTLAQGGGDGLGSGTAHLGTGRGAELCTEMHSRGHSQLPSHEPRDSPGDPQGLCQPYSWSTRDLLPALG